jgi:hypothetical protein
MKFKGAVSRVAAQKRGLSGRKEALRCPSNEQSRSESKSSDMISMPIPGFRKQCIFIIVRKFQMLANHDPAAQFQ